MQDITIKKVEEYLGYLRIRATNLRQEGKEFEALEIDAIVHELGTLLNLRQFL